MKEIISGRKKMLYPEVLRTVAILGVITQHVTSRMISIAPVDTMNYQIAEIFHILVQWCVPLFLSISGIFLLDPKRDIPLKKIYFSYIPRILIAIVVMVPVCEAVEIMIKGNSIFTWDSLKNIAYALIYSHGNKVYWYLYMLLGIYLYLPIYRAIVKGFSQNGLKYLLIIAFIGISVIPYLLMLDSHFTWLEPVSFFAKKLKMKFLFREAYFLFLGYYLHTYPPTEKAKKVIYVLSSVSLASCVLIGLLVSGAKGSYVEKWTVDGTPLPYIVTLGLFVLFKEVSEKIEKKEKITNLFFFTGKNSFGVYLTHIMIMRALWKMTYRAWIPGLLYIPGLILATFLLSNLVVYILRKIPFFRYWL